MEETPKKLDYSVKQKKQNHMMEKAISRADLREKLKKK